MPSLTTIFRAVVMLAVGAVVFKGWQMYGPPTEQGENDGRASRRYGTGGVEEFSGARTRMRSRQLSRRRLRRHLLKRLSRPRMTRAIVPPALSTPDTHAEPADGRSSHCVCAVDAVAHYATGCDIAAPASTSDDRVQTLMSRLEQLGGADPKIGTWGSSGHLFRCCCQAPLANSPAVTQHFESVAAEPALAVEQVVAKVEAWRTAQRDIAYGAAILDRIASNAHR